LGGSPDAVSRATPRVIPRTRTVLSMRKSLMVLVLVTTCALGPSAGVTTASGDNGAAVTRATLASGFVDENGIFYPATCDEIQVINGNQRKESFPLHVR
jgi:hypothetical protein